MNTTNGIYENLPRLEKDTLELLTTPQVKSGDRLKVAGDFARLAAIPTAGMFLVIVLWDFTETAWMHAVFGVALVVCGGMTVALLAALLYEFADHSLRMKEWSLNLKSTRLYIENSAPDIENLVIQRGKTNVANVGQIQNNVIGTDALKEFNRQYQVARLILDLLAQAPARRPKPFSYEAVNKALTARGLSQVEVPQWQGAVQLLEGTVLQNGVAPTKWEQLRQGPLAESALDEAMRNKGLSKSSHGDKVEWHLAS